MIVKQSFQKCNQNYTKSYALNPAESTLETSGMSFLTTKVRNFTINPSEATEPLISSRSFITTEPPLLCRNQVKTTA